MVAPSARADSEPRRIDCEEGLRGGQHVVEDTSALNALQPLALTLNRPCLDVAEELDSAKVGREGTIRERLKGCCGTAVGGAAHARRPRMEAPLAPQLRRVAAAASEEEEERIAVMTGYRR